MVSEEESRHTVPAAGAPRAGKPATATAGAAAGERAIAVFQKCPYLAGRPPCGTYALFPSGTNVCWATPGEGKPYRGISRDTQRAHCLREPDGPSGCERYRRAIAEARPAPRFGSWLNAPHGAEARPGPSSGGIRIWQTAPLLRRAAWLLPLFVTVLLLLLAILR